RRTQSPDGTRSRGASSGLFVFRRRGEMASRKIGAALAALTIVLSSVPTRADTLAERVDRMERELRELKAELRRRDEADRRRAAREARGKHAGAAPAGERREPAASTPPAPAPSATAPAGKPAPVATAQARPERAEAPMPTTRVPYLDRVRVGGYGSFRF